MVLGFEKFPCFGASCFVLLLFSCTEVEYDNPYDPNNPNADVRYSSSSVAPSSSSVVPSSSSIKSSSSSIALSLSSSSAVYSNIGSVSYGGQTYISILTKTVLGVFMENIILNTKASPCDAVQWVSPGLISVYSKNRIAVTAQMVADFAVRG